MGDFDDDFIPVGEPEPPEPEPRTAEPSWRDRKLDNSPPPESCPECGGEFEEDYRIGSYVVLVCQVCDLYMRHFPPEPMTVWHGGDEEAEED